MNLAEQSATANKKMSKATMAVAPIDLIEQLVNAIKTDNLPLFKTLVCHLPNINMTLFTFKLLGYRHNNCKNVLMLSIKYTTMKSVLLVLRGKCLFRALRAAWMSTQMCLVCRGLEQGKCGA